MNIIETSTESKPSPNAARAARLSQAGPKENARRLGRRARALLFGSLIVAPVVIGSLIAARYLQFQNLASETERMTVPTVQVVRPTPGPSATEITLPGNLAPYSESSIYARTNGYLKAWKTDLGAKVAAGQLMAEISAPDVDAQLAPVSSLALAGAAVTGFGFSLVFPALGVEAVRSFPSSSQGAALGVYTAFVDLSLGVSGPLAGAIASRLGYPQIFLFAAAMAGFSLTLSLILYWKHIKALQRPIGGNSTRVDRSKTLLQNATTERL